MRLRAALLPLALSLACSGGSSGPSVAPGSSSTGTAPADPLAPIAWLEGRWQTAAPADPAAEHWTRVGPSLHGVGFTTKGGRTSFFEVLLIHHKDGGLVYTAMPGGRRIVDFPAREIGDRSAVFANPTHDFPQTLHYRRAGDGLAATAAAPGATAQEFAWQLGPAGSAAELEAADRAFAADVAARGLDAWPEWFDPEGVQWRDKPVVGREAIRALMAPSFAAPDFRIDWAPVASGMSPAGDLGYTVGRARATWKGEDGAPAPPYCGTYVTIWRRQANGDWRALFDTGWDDRCPDQPGA
jgi:ketosteroid isomerase-like protein